TIILRIEVKTADTGGRHVWHRQAIADHGPAGMNRWRRGSKPHAQSRRVAAQVPDGLTHRLLSFRRQTIIRGLDIMPALSLHSQLPDVIPAHAVFDARG